MPESTIKPPIIELKRTEFKDGELRLHLLVHWNINQETVQDIDGIESVKFTYEEAKIVDVYDGLPSNISKYLSDIKNELVVKGKKTKGEEALSITERGALIDRNISRAIGGRLNPGNGIGEQFKIMRKQIENILISMSMTPDVEFNNLSQIATEEIEKGKAKKALLA